MSIRTTVTLDDDVMTRVQGESRARGLSFRETLNNLIRAGFLNADSSANSRTLQITPFHMGRKPGLNYDDIEGLLANAEGESHR